MNDQKKHWLEGEHVVSSSICTPGVRTVSLQLYDDGPESEPRYYRHIVPVLAIETRVVEKYGKMSYDEKESSMFGSTRRVLKAAGYRFHRRDVEIKMIHAYSDLMPATLDSSDDCDVASNGRGEIVSCMWPVDEDEKRFEPIWKRLEEDLKDREEAEKSKKAEAKTDA